MCPAGRSHPSPPAQVPAGVWIRSGTGFWIGIYRIPGGRLEDREREFGSGHIGTSRCFCSKGWSFCRTGLTRDNYENRESIHAEGTIYQTILIRAIYGVGDADKKRPCQSAEASCTIFSMSACLVENHFRDLCWTTQARLLEDAIGFARATQT